MNFLFLTFRLYLQKIIQPLSENFCLVFQKYKLGVQANKLWGKCFGWSTKLFNISLFWAKTFRTFWQESFGRFVKNAVQGNNLRRTTFFGKIICSFESILDFEPKCLKTLMEIFQYSCRICILRVQGKSLRKKVIENVDSYSIP